MYKVSRKKQTVQLTSLLDLLFVMIFVSLIQQHEVKPVETKKEKKETKPKPVAKPEPKPQVQPIKQQTSYAIKAVFHFYPIDQNPSLPEGKYVMQGMYNTKSGELQLGGVQWLQRPPHYDMIPLSGTVPKGGDIFRGRVEFQGCREFSLQRVEKNAKTPLSGVWKGTYECSQGPTGLSLHIE